MRGRPREGERRGPRARSSRAEPSQAERSPSAAEPSRAEHLPPPPPPRAPGARPPPSPEPRCRPKPPTMPRAPPAPATPQPRAALSARSCRAAAPGMQVSEKDPHAPTRGSRPCPSPLRASRRARVRPPAASAQAPLPRRAPQPSAGPHSILPSWRSGHRPRGCLHPALGSALGSSRPPASGSLSAVGAPSLRVPRRPPGPRLPPTPAAVQPRRRSAGLWRAGCGLGRGRARSPDPRLPPHPRSSPAHNRSVRSEEAVGEARQPGDCGLPGGGGTGGAGPGTGVDVG